MRLIDADRLKEEIVEAGQGSTRYRIGEFYELNRNEIWKVIDEQPTVEPGRKNGRWVAVGECYVKCSECGLETTKNELRGITLFGKNEPYFCPNCGADMREGEPNANN